MMFGSTTKLEKYLLPTLICKVDNAAVVSQILIVLEYYTLQ